MCLFKLITRIYLERWKNETINKYRKIINERFIRKYTQKICQKHKITKKKHYKTYSQLKANKKKQKQKENELCGVRVAEKMKSYIKYKCSL